MSVVPAAEPQSAPAARLSPIERTVRVFAQPANAWADLRERGQWWFPLLLSLGVWVVLQALAYDPLIVPMMLDQWSEAVANGRMESAQAESMSRFFTESPAARWIVLGQQAIVWPIIYLLQALVVWFGGGFVLGTKLRFRQAFDVVSWSSLVKLPQVILFFVLAWQRGSFQGVHLGLGVLVPESESPGKLQLGLTTFLDFFGPFEAWWIVVAVLGVAAITGAARRSVAWVLVALYLAFGVFLAAVNAFFGPGV